MPEPSVLRSVSLRTLERLDAKLEPTLATLKHTFTAIELNPDLTGLRNVTAVMVEPRQDFADMKFPTELGGGAQSVAELVQGLPLQEVAMLKAPFKAGIEDIAESRTAGLAMATGLMGLIDAGITPGDKELTQLVNLGLGADVVSRTARAKLIGVPQPDLPDILGGLSVPSKLLTNIAEIRQALARAGAALQLARNASKVTYTSDADGITEVIPRELVSGGDEITLNGSFPNQQPEWTSVDVAGEHGQPIPCQIVSWSDKSIRVSLPPGVQTGPIGFLRASGPDAWSSVDLTGFAEAANILGASIGAGGGITFHHSLSSAANLFNLLDLPRPMPPELPGFINLLTAGPIIDQVSPATYTEPDQATWIKVRGRGFRSSDAVVIDSITCETKFVADELIQFRGRAIPSGRYEIRISRNSYLCGTRNLMFEVHASYRGVKSVRVRPGGVIQVEGTGFGPGFMSARLGGVSVNVRVFNTYVAEVEARRGSSTSFVRDPDGETTTLELFYGGQPFGSSSIVFETIRLLAFGDSVMWGQGLLHPNKLSTLVGEKLKERFSGRGVYADEIYAHSGATVVPPTGELLPGRPSLLPPSDGRDEEATRGEVPSSSPSISAQIRAWDRPELREAAARVDVVLLDGGINDVNVRNIIHPFNSDDALRRDTERFCGGIGMTPLLHLALRVFPNARIIVIGYYPIVSEQSNTFMILLLLSTLAIVSVTAVPGLTAAALAIIHERMNARSRIFFETSSRVLAETVHAAGPRVTFVPSGFGPEHAFAAPQSRLWGLGFPAEPIDPIALARRRVCTGDAICQIASIAHPNPDGARAYADAIAPHLPTP